MLLKLFFLDFSITLTLNIISVKMILQIFTIMVLDYRPVFLD